jgi:hypothetical protein
LAIAFRGRGATGKLKAAARAWAFARVGRIDTAQAASIDADVQQQFAELGVSVEIDEDGRDDVEVWAVNWRALTAFLACTTQWRVVPRGMALDWMGLDYAAVDVVLRHLGETTATFRDLMVMEEAALEAFSEAQP